MKVLFLKEVENVASPGEVKDVANGFARNYLLPKQIAVPATPGTLKQHEAVIEQEKKRAERVISDLRDLAGKLEGSSVTLKARAGQDGRLYGSVTANDVTQAIQNQLGYTVDRRVVHLDEPIRRVGDYDVPVRLRRDIVSKVRVTVEAENPGA